MRWDRKWKKIIILKIRILKQKSNRKEVNANGKRNHKRNTENYINMMKTNDKKRGEKVIIRKETFDRKGNYKWKKSIKTRHGISFPKQENDAGFLWVNVTKPAKASFWTKNVWGLETEQASK